MNTKTKEEILDKVFKRDCGWTFDELIQNESHANLKQSSALIGYSISESMEQYAQQEAIGFNRWKESIGVIKESNSTHYLINYAMSEWSLFAKDEEELYKKYQQSKNK